MNKIKDAFGEIKASDELKAKTINFIKEANKAEETAQVTDNSNNVVDMPKVKRRRRFAPAVAFLMVCFTLFFTSNVFFAAESYVGIDINPSIELKVNRFDKVIGYTAYNKDGEKVLNSLNIKYKDYDEAVDLIYDEVAKDGYFTDDSYIAVSVQTNNNEKRRSIGMSLKTNTENCISKNHLNKAVYEIVDVSPEERKQASKAGVSSGKYKAIEELEKYDDKATVEKYKHHSIKDIKKKTAQCKETYQKTQKRKNKQTHNNKNKQTYKKKNNKQTYNKQNKQTHKQNNHSGQGQGQGKGSHK